MSKAEDTPMTWVKSSYSSGDGGQCIEWAPSYARAHGVVPVRDSKDPEGPALMVPAESFAAFVVGVKDGEFPAV
ncbi:DUF397 domain-containing protein [Streptomyces sp. ISL-100]|uniref:DUF397 domain-containing protein n=1 Tax=Streptomyces sp. ISL-100 TaxID=2819173 RepID=UPI001BEBA2E6|nr:DUF397 domain-containing protein [Streptomyces sp. ISL-100]MBT2397946.1 DUF397 domain-containing protein [Streptomyces sp. ISL-100]